MYLWTGTKKSSIDPKDFFVGREVRAKINFIKFFVALYEQCNLSSLRQYVYLNRKDMGLIYKTLKMC